MIQTINYFDEKSGWFKKSKIADELLNLNGKNIQIVKNIMQGKIKEEQLKNLIDAELSKLNSYFQ